MERRNNSSFHINQKRLKEFLINNISFFHRQRHNFLQHTHRSFHISHIFYQHTSLAVLFTQVTTAGIFHHIIYHFTESLTLIERTIRVGDKEQRHPTTFQEDLLCSQACCQTTERNNTKQFFRFRAEQVRNVSRRERNASTSLIQHQTVQFTIKQHTFATARHVISRQ